MFLYAKLTTPLAIVPVFSGMSARPSWEHLTKTPVLGFRIFLSLAMKPGKSFSAVCAKYRDWRAFKVKCLAFYSNHNSFTFSPMVSIFRKKKVSLVIIVVFCLSKLKCRLQTNISYPENEDNSKSVVVSASEHIYDAQSKGVQHKTMVKPALKAEGTRPG